LDLKFAVVIILNPEHRGDRRVKWNDNNVT